MAGFALPSKGLVTAQGFRPVGTIQVICDEKAESEKAFRQIGKYLDWVDIAYNDILVGKYIPDKIGTLITSAETQREQRWQNKVGLVLKYGPTAKQDGFKYEVGDWVYYRSSDGHEVGIKNENAAEPYTLGLYLSPAHIMGQLRNPDVLW